MSDLFRKLLTSTFVTTIVQKLARHGATWLGGFILAWLSAHNADPAQANTLVEYLVGAVVTAAGIGWSMIDAKKVDTDKKVTAAIAYDAGAQAQADGVAAQRDVDQHRADTVKAAIVEADAKAPADKAALLASLRAGVGAP